MSLPVDVVVEGGRVVSSQRIFEANIAIKGGKIVSVGKKVENGERKIDGRGKYVLPGVIDAHAHIYDPLRAHIEDFKSGTAAAAAGGVTTVILMPLESPLDSAESVQSLISIGQRDSFVDFSIHSGMINERNVGRVREIAKLGVKSFKVFMCAPYGVSNEVLYEIMKTVLAAGGIVNVHAEDSEMVEEYTGRLRRIGRMDPAAHAESRPNIVEKKAITKAVDLAAKAKAHLHISHVSTKEGARILRDSKKKGANVTGETCPHYLTFTKEDLRKYGPYLKVNPPLKSRMDRLSLWRSLREGWLDIVTSEHAPGLLEEKEVGWKDIWSAWSGVPSIEAMLPILLSKGVNEKRLPMQTLCKVLCENPAKIFGLYPTKGVVQVGSDADLVLVDLDAVRTVRSDEVHYKVKWTPYDGMKLQGFPVLTMVRGETVFHGNEVVGKPGHGRFTPMRSVA